MRLDGKTAVITGGASGIGRCTVLEFAKSGAHVIFGDINEEGGGAVAREVADAGGQAHFFPLDVSDKEAIDGFCAKAQDTAGEGVQIVVNVAGWDRIEPFMDNTDDFWRKVVDINYLGPVRLTRQFLPAMIEAGGGKIVSVASDAGRVGSMGETIYAGAKGGIIAFTKSLAREMARFKINVNCVCPGPTNTPLLMAQPEKMREALTPGGAVPPPWRAGRGCRRDPVLRLRTGQLHHRANPVGLRRPDHGRLSDGRGRYIHPPPRH